jgi:hypothetical protein
MDKIGKIATFPVTSSPIHENMVPIISKNAIGYINWHHIEFYKIDDFKEPDSRYQGSIANKEAFNIARLLHSSIYLNMHELFDYSKFKIINRYLDYIDEFEERGKSYEQYEHKVLPTNVHSKKLKLTVTFKREYNDDISPADNFCVDEISIPMLEEDEPQTTVINNNDTADDVQSTKVSVTIENNDCDKPTIYIDLTSQAILTAVSMIEDSGDTITLPRMAKNMSEDDIKLFMAYLKLNSQSKASKIYGLSQTGIGQKQKSINKMYNIIYTT